MKDARGLKVQKIHSYGAGRMVYLFYEDMECACMSERFGVPDSQSLVTHDLFAVQPTESE